MSDLTISTATDLAALKKAARWLNAYGANVTSQCGEDGILAKCLELLPATDRWCVEFGAHDGKQMSNSYNLISARDYRAVLIEPDPKHFRTLNTTYEYRDRIIPIQAFVGFTETDGLDALLAPLPIPTDFDVLIVDVDGYDYHIWNAVRRYRPKIVAVEYNFTMSNHVHFVQETSTSRVQGSSASAIAKLGKRKGYELVAVTPVNLIFVDAMYFEYFGISDNSLELMRDDSACPQVFVAYDGEIKLVESGRHGAITLPWHRSIRIHERSLQPLARLFRKHPASYPVWKWWALRLRYPSTMRRNPVNQAITAVRSRLGRKPGRSDRSH